VRLNTTFQRKFNHFYRVRRGATWQGHFYNLLEQKKRQRITFSEILETLHKTTNRYEASFASKLAATIDPTFPVIDSIVLRNLKLKLPPSRAEGRLSLIDELHSDLKRKFEAYLLTDSGKYLLSEFSRTYPNAQITSVKMVDLVLWQTRPSPALQRTRRKRRAADR